MEHFKKLTLRYNPQSIEKQVRKWPVLFSEEVLHNDLVFRVKQIIGETADGWISPFTTKYSFDEDFIAEYGIDACRLATISSSNNPALAESLLESSFKWLARVYSSFSQNTTAEFNPVPWLEALLQLQDHIIKRNADNQALALVKKAFKEAPPSKQTATRNLQLVASVLSPFAPILASKLLCNEQIVNRRETISQQQLLALFPEYIYIKVALEKGGWHWQVFSRKIYEDNPMIELSKIKWINSAINGKNTKLVNTDGGLRICFY